MSNIDPNVRSVRIDELFSEQQTLARYLDVEISLAKVQAKVGIIPADAAKAIATHATTDLIDVERFRTDFQRVGFPIVSLVKQLAEKIPNGYGEYAHWGATTQDIMDTALVLTLRDVCAQIEDGLRSTLDLLSALAGKHVETLTAGRSQLQHAVPVTFGYKVAGWLTPMNRHLTRLAELRPRLLQVQLGGAVGTMSALHPNGPVVRRALAGELGLQEPAICWHTLRDSLSEFVSFLGLMASSAAKIATDVMLLAQTEVGELREPAASGRGVSSTMPQKRNPVLSQQIVVAARLVRRNAASMLDATVQDHERGSATWQTEWSLIPDAASHAVATIERLQELVRGLEVDSVRMKANLDLSRQFVYAESVMMALAPKLGRQRAHDLVEAAVGRAIGELSFEESLLQNTEIRDVLSGSDLRRIFDGHDSVAAARAATQAVLAELP